MTNVSDASLVSSVNPAKSRRGLWWKFPLTVVVLAVICFGLDRLWTRVIRDYFYPRNWGVVEPGKVFRSGLISHRIIRRTLADNHVGLVLCMTGDDPKSHDFTFERNTCAELGIRRRNFNLNGTGAGDPKQYIEALVELAGAEKSGVPVLVHCKTGAQRTGGMVVFYRVLIEGKSGKQAYAELLQYGHEPDKNPVLVPYLNEHMGEVAQALVNKGVIKQVPNPLPVIEP